MSETVSVAPREIHDLVFRACRVRGCGPGLADRVAANIAFTEIHHGGGLAAFIGSIDSTTVAATLAESPSRIAGAEVEARESGTATLCFDPPVLFAAAALALHDASTRGVAWTLVADSPVIHGLDPVVQLEFCTVASEVDPYQGAAWNGSDRAREVLSEGLDVDAAQWRSVAEVAAEFLVPELVLDQLVEIDPAT